MKRLVKGIIITLGAVNVIYSVFIPVVLSIILVKLGANPYSIIPLGMAASLGRALKPIIGLIENE